MDPKVILIIALVVVMGWFAVGLLFNLRRGNAVLRWMQDGLPLLGEKTTFRWLGSTVAELEITRPKRPFRNIKLILVLQPRDVPWMWAAAALRGRRDTLIFRSQSADSPAFDAELADPAFWTARPSIEEANRRGWTCQAQGNRQFCSPPESFQKATEALPGLEAAIAQTGSQPYRMGLRCESHLVEVHLPLPEIRTQNAKDYFRAFIALAQAASERH